MWIYAIYHIEHARLAARESPIGKSTDRDPQAERRGLELDDDVRPGLQSEFLHGGGRDGDHERALPDVEVKDLNPESRGASNPHDDRPPEVSRAPMDPRAGGKDGDGLGHDAEFEFHSRSEPPRRTLTRTDGRDGGRNIGSRD